jgi:hypothetical protein
MRNKGALIPPAIACDLSAGRGKTHYVRDTTSVMKSSTLPPVRVPEGLRDAAESVLTDGETLSSFIQQSVERAVEFRRIQAAFDARAGKALKHYKRTGISHAADAVVARLQTKLDRKRKQLLG